MNRFEFFPGTYDLSQDVARALGPDEGFGILVMRAHILLDSGTEVADTAEHATLESILIQAAKEALDHVHPGCRSGGKVHMKARVPG